MYHIILYFFQILYYIIHPYSLWFHLPSCFWLGYDNAWGCCHTRPAAGASAFSELENPSKYPQKHGVWPCFTPSLVGPPRPQVALCPLRPVGQAWRPGGSIGWILGFHPKWGWITWDWRWFNGKTIGKPYENGGFNGKTHRKTIGKWRFTLW